MAAVKIRDLIVYPVKSFSGQHLTEAIATPSGFQNDRQWAVFKNDGHPLTQRQNPKMCLIRPTVTKTGLKLSSEGYGNIDVQTQTGEVHEFHIWKDRVTGEPYNNEVNQWISEVLKETQPLQLVKVAKNAQRHFSNPARFQTQGQYFSDAAPYLIANQNSLEQVNQAIEQSGKSPIDMRHFRANIVLEGLPAFDEHRFSHISSEHGSGFRLVDHCQRCIMITVDPDKGEYLPKAHPFKIVASLNGMPDNPKAPAFGVNACLDDALQTSTNRTVLKVGQRLSLN